MKNIRIFLSENFHFLVAKFSVSLNRRVFVMFYKIKNCLKNDFFISCDDRIGKMLHNICISGVAMSLR